MAIHKADPNAPQRRAIDFPAPLGPLWVTQMGQVSALQLQAALQESGYKPPAIQSWLPAHLVPVPFSINNPDHAAAYDAALTNYLGWPQNYTSTLSSVEITYFAAQAKFDKRSGTVAALGSPGLFLPYALAYINKTMANKRGPYASWTQALDIKFDAKAQLLARAHAIVDRLSEAQLTSLIALYD